MTEILCPICKNPNFNLEVSHAHCNKCQGVIYFHELYCIARYGKKTIDKELDNTLKELGQVLDYKIKPRLSLWSKLKRVIGCNGD